MPERFSPRKRASAAPQKKASTKKKTIAKKGSNPPKKQDKTQKGSWTNVHAKYKKSRTRNVFMAILLAILSLFIFGIVIIAALPLLWSVDINFSGVVTKFLPEGVTGPALPSERINMIVLGRGGFENDAPDLTDSIMFLSYDNSVPASEARATMVSIPRDLYVYSELMGYTRINALYAGTKRRLGHEGAMRHLMQKVAEITGKQVDHYVMVDFRGFRDFVDRIGGIDMYVPERIYDTAYPDSNWGYTIFKLDPGLQHLDGDTALRYVRSRHSTSDFDRSRRQQLIMKTVKQKLIDDGYLRSPKKVEDLFVTLSDNFQTSFSLSQIVHFGALMHDFDSQYQMQSFSLNDGCFESLSFCDPGGLLYAPERELTDGQAVLLPNGATAANVGEYGVIQKFVHIVMNYPEMIDHTREIHIFNATSTPGIAFEFALRLKSFGFNVPQAGAIGNADIDDSTDSFLLYSSELSADDPTLAALEVLFFGEQKAEILPVFAEVGESAIEIILGDDSSIFFRN